MQAVLCEQLMELLGSDDVSCEGMWNVNLGRSQSSELKMTSCIVRCIVMLPAGSFRSKMPF